MKELAKEHDDGYCNARNAFAHQIANRVIFMDGGVVVEQGTPEEVFTNPKKNARRSFYKCCNKLRKVSRHMP